MDGNVQKGLKQLKDAVEATNLTLETKLAAIRETVDKGFADNKTALELIHLAISHLDGTIGDKLAEIKTAISD